MSIPERLSRIVRHKITEMKDRFDQMDEDAMLDPAEMERLRRAQLRAEARKELDESLATPVQPFSSGPTHVSQPAPQRSASPDLPLRSPQQISGGALPQSAPAARPTLKTPTDPLEYHYKMLGVEVGADMGTVQSAYTALAARTEPGRFPVGSAEASELEDIRQRLETSYRVLRDALDSTAHRFGLLELDPTPASPREIS